MTQLMRRLSALLFLSGAFALLSATRVDAQQLSLAAVDARVVVADGVATATFRIKVTNHEPAAMTNVVVVFGDESADSLGDVPPGGDVVSEPETKFIEVTNESRSIPVPLTVRFSMNGEPVEVKMGVSLESAQ